MIVTQIHVKTRADNINHINRIYMNFKIFCTIFVFFITTHSVEISCLHFAERSVECITNHWFRRFIENANLDLFQV